MRTEAAVREEQQRGSSLRIAIINGYQKAFRTILDANLTTFITAAILFWVGCGLLCVILMAPMRRRTFAPLLWVAGVALGATLLFVSMRGVVEGSRDTAVILPAQLDVQSAPGEEGRTVFTLHSGTEVRLDRVLGGWVEISMGPDLKGWAHAHIVERRPLGRQDGGGPVRPATG